MDGLLVPLLMAGALSLTCTPLVMRLAGRVGAIDLPDRRKMHTSPMPRLGGLAIYLAFVFVILVTQQLTGEVLGLLAGSTLIVALGILDDTRGVTPKVKLLGQVVAALSVIPFGLQVEFITNPVHSGMIALGWWGIPLTVFWLVAVTNAVNLIDGLDGLAAGIAAIAALTMSVISWTEGQIAAMVISLILFVAVLGFLPYNFHPARIFLGDTGSMFLGFALAATAIMGLTKSATAVSILIPIVILGIPLFDTAFAIFRRYRNRQPIFYPDKQHLHHRLLEAGLSHRRAVLTVYGVNLVLGASAVLLTVLSTDQGMLLLLVVATLLIGLANKAGILGEGWARRTEPVQTKQSEF
ncbi:MAG: MraY family glycosyltransferase [Bacillota bacterium]|uniref:MraY family glycosyltransferase n=1 Tax=Desulforudis sp. DRI-14 TaxID=3459793 RepID=UPI00348A8FB4